MKYLSVCSGIEAATVAWEPLGFTPAGFSEIDPFPRAVLKHHHPDVPLFGDFTEIQADDVGPIDILVGGTPCQSFSIAGLRGGLDDDRGNLALEFCRLAVRTRPRRILWENVPGVLSSNDGKDFGSFLGALAECGYGFAYRILDAQYCRVQSHAFAVPQRRRRVFVVGYLGDWRRAAQVLFERESLRRNNPPSRKAGQKVAGTISSRTTGGGGLGTDFDLDGGLVSHSLRGEGFDASEDGTGRGTPIVSTSRMVAFGEYVNDGTASTVKQRDYKDATDLIAFTSKDHGGDAGEVSPTLRSMSNDKSHANGGGQVAIAIQERAVCENPNAGPDGAGIRSDGSSYTLEARNQTQAVCFDWQSGGSQVRRLTPRECERLQGFPDNYTQVPYRNKPAKDGPRYKALGNSMAVNCMSWIGQRIKEVNA